MIIQLASLPIVMLFIQLILGFDGDQWKLRKTISHFEFLDYPTDLITKAHKRCRRDLYSRVDSHPLIRLAIPAFNRTFLMILFPDSDLIDPSARLTVGGKDHPFHLSSYVDHVYRGYLANHPESYVYGSIINGVFRGVITPDPSIVGSYFIEPAPYFFTTPTPFHSIIYHESDVKPHIVRRARRSVLSKDSSSFCGLSNPLVAKKLKDQSKPVKNIGVKAINYRSRRDTRTSDMDSHSLPSHYNAYAHTNRGAFYTNRLSTPFTITGATTRVCNLYLLSDTFLWDRVISMQHIRGDKELAVKEITSIFTQHVQGVQAIYQHTVFRDHAGRFEYPGISFRVDHVLINVTDEDCKQCSTNRTNPENIPPSPTALPQSNETGEGRIVQHQQQQVGRGSCVEDNPFCTANMDVTNFLNLHSYTAHDDFCLAYVFTYRDFLGGTLGLAWVAESSGSGGVCEKHRLMREGSHNVHKSLNTGVVTLLNYGSQVALKVSQLTFAHEVGHNFGAKHDDDHKDESHACMPSVDDPRGNYLMFASATSGYKDNNNKFSKCSTDSIATLLNRILSDDGNCFITSDGPFCGNQLTEDGEECDCGFKPSDCRDQCCHPKASSSPCKLKPSVFVNHSTMPVQCSPTAGECCTHECQYRSQSHLCRSAGECYRASYCNGNEANCPVSEHLPDGTPCQDHTRVCKQGQCLGSICEIIPGWTECSLTRVHSHITPEMMCFVSCRSNKTGAQCISTLQMERTSLTKDLLRHSQGTRLKPGAPCDNFRGYCDDFHRCQFVEVQGPLTRMRNLLFSPQVLEKFRIWATMYWWAMILICLGSIIAMIIFVKLCSVSTPRSRYTGRPLPRLLAVGSDEEVGGHFWLTTSRPSFHRMCYPRPITSSTSAVRTTRPQARGAHSRSHEGKRRKRYAPRSTPTRGAHVVPTAPPHPLSASLLDPMDFPPSHVRQTPIPYHSTQPVDNPTNFESVSLIPVTLTQSVTGSNANSSSQTDLSAFNRRHSEGTDRKERIVSRPTSMVIPPSAPSTSQAGPNRKSKLPSKLNRAKIPDRPQSTMISSNQNSVDSNQPVISQCYPSNTAVQIFPEQRLNIPPPAYDDLPNRLNVSTKQQSTR